MSAFDDTSSLAERVRQAREASAFLETGRDTWAGASITASNSSCDTRRDTPDEEPARPEEGRLRSAIRSALGAFAVRPAEGTAGAADLSPAGADAAGASPAETGLDGGGPVPRLQEPVDISEAAQATRTISLRLTEGDFLLVQERCREHGLSRSDYIRQLVRTDAVVGDSGMRRVVVLDRTSVLSVAKEMRAWGRHYNQAVHALNIMAKYLRSHGGADEGDEDDIAEALASVRVKLDGVEHGRERIEAQLKELCCLDAIRGR
ncbi:MAG: hypothetical protein Q4E45_12445 [Eubacteriales bacterium]|nr:hypothetical protein [Eubacteriales bacterium]